MAELKHTDNIGINISTPQTVLTYTYSGPTPVETITSVSLGSGAHPIAGGGNYQLGITVNGTPVLPDPAVSVSSGIPTALMISKIVTLRTGDTISVSALGLAGDTAVDVSTTLFDVTPAVYSDIFGSGTRLVDSDFGGTDDLSYKTAQGAGVNNAVVQAYTTADYNAGNHGQSYVLATVTTDMNGRWIRGMMLNPNSYTLIYYKQGAYGPDRKDIVVT